MFMPIKNFILAIKDDNGDGEDDDVDRYKILPPPEWALVSTNIHDDDDSVDNDANDANDDNDGNDENDENDIVNKNLPYPVWGLAS